jgi:glucose/arabinose dehydrogenase
MLMNRLTLYIASVLFPASLLLGQIQLQSAFPSLSFTRPVDIQAPPDSSNRLAIVSQPGIIYIFPNSSSVQSAKVFLDIRDSVQSIGSEEGLLGLAFHPNFKNNRYIFVNHTGKNPRRDVVARYTVSATNPDSVVTGSRVSILEIYDPYENHNAGQLAFGPDGFLYIGTGDGGSGGDPQNRAQNPDSLLGKMLRIDVDNSDPGHNYAIPPTNPYYGMISPRPEIWAMGLRNPWRYSFDPVTGKLWLADVGQNAWEEIDTVQRGKNYGWRIMEGNNCYDPSTGCNQTGLTLPVWEYMHPGGNGSASITGGYVYRGSSILEFQGKYVYADFVFGSIWILNYDTTGGPVNSLFSNSGFNISSFGVDQNKELYLSAFNGKIYKFVKTSSTAAVDNFAPPAGFMLSQNFPNPFNPSTTLRFELPENEFVTLVVYSLVGQRVKTVVQAEFSAGTHQVQWDGTNDLGQPMPTAVYFYRLTAGSLTKSRRMILLK